MIKLKLIFIPFIFFGFSIANAQEPTVTLPKNAISFVPQYAIINGIRIDYERRIKNGNNWLVIAPTFFLDANNYSYSNYNHYSYSYPSNSLYNYETMVGVGVNLYYKSFVYESNKINAVSGLPRASIYISAGPNYQHLSLTSSEEVAVPSIHNGNTHYQLETKEITRTINRFGAIGNVGYQFAFGRFLLDAYLGVALKYSTENGSLIKASDADWIDLDYSGILLDGGLRVGIFF